MFEPSFYCLAFLAIFLGAVVQSLIGFGMAIVAAPLLYLIEPALVPVPLLLQGTAISLMNYWRYRRSASLTTMGVALIWRIPGSLLGLWLLLAFDANVVRLLIAIAVLMGVATTMTQASLPINRWSLALAGFISGIFSTAAAIGGPPIALLLRSQQAATLRANLAAFFTVSCIISLIILALGGQVSFHHVILAILLLPAVLSGFFVAKRYADQIERHHIQVLTQLLCTGSAVALIAQVIQH